jgi:hypothetical protein
MKGILFFDGVEDAIAYFGWAQSSRSIAASPNCQLPFVLPDSMAVHLLVAESPDLIRGWTELDWQRFANAFWSMWPHASSGATELALQVAISVSRERAAPH